jgi:hypothetical protein
MLSDEFSIFNMSGTILGLTAAIGPDESRTVSTSSSLSPADTAIPLRFPRPSSSRLKHSAIIGIAFTGLFVIICSFIACVMSRRRRKHKELLNRSVNPLPPNTNVSTVPRLVVDEKVRISLRYMSRIMTCLKEATYMASPPTEWTHHPDAKCGDGTRVGRPIAHLASRTCRPHKQYR